MLRLRFFPLRRGEVRNCHLLTALDSPFVISKLVTPPLAINSDMWQVIDDATSAMNATHDDASTFVDDNVSLGEFLDEQIARTKAFVNAETDEIIETEHLETPVIPSSPRYELPKIPEGHVMDEEIARYMITHKYRGSQQFSRVEYSAQIY